MVRFGERFIFAPLPIRQRVFLFIPPAKTYPMNIKSILLELNARPIAYYPIYRKITGSTTAGILLSQIMYWWAKMDGEKFYKTDAEIKEETLLTDNELRGAKNRLKRFRFVSITREGVPAKTNYQIDFDILLNKISEIHETGLVEKTKQESLKEPNSIHKTTHKTTSVEEEAQAQNHSKEEKDLIKKIGKSHFNLLAKNKSDFPKLGSEKLSLFFEWLEYKKNRRENYKEFSGLKLIALEFKDYSPGEISTAIKTSKKSNWQGLFIKNQKNGKRISKNGKLVTAEQQIEALARLRREGL